MEQKPLFPSTLFGAKIYHFPGSLVHIDLSFAGLEALSDTLIMHTQLSQWSSFKSVAQETIEVNFRLSVRLSFLVISFSSLRGIG